MVWTAVYVGKPDGGCRQRASHLPVPSSAGAVHPGELPLALRSSRLTAMPEGTPAGTSEPTEARMASSSQAPYTVPSRCTRTPMA